MSYDFTLFPPIAGEDPLVTIHRGLEDSPGKARDVTKDALKARVAEALIAHNSQLSTFPFDYDEIAKSENFSVEEAQLRYRHIELNGPDDGNGIQITLFDDEASVTVPYWHEGGKAESTFREIWEYLRIIQRETGYLVYDQQLGRIVDLASDFDAAIRCYCGASAHVRATFQVPDGPSKPWWKFW
jgi:hypothetical protein